MTTQTIVDRDQPCRTCGSLGARELHDGAIECVGCGRVQSDRFVIAKRSLTGFGSGGCR